MHPRPRWVEALPRLYAVVNATGLLNTRWGRGLFVRSYFAYKRYLEDPFFQLVRRRPELFAGGDIVDVGANIGYTAGVFAAGLSAGHRVYAFEPDPSNYALLCESIHRRGADAKIVAVQAAVGPRSGTVRLWRNERHHGDHRIATDAFAVGAPAGHMVEVPMVSLDEFGRRQGWRVTFIKVDVQGYEPAVCEGMVETIVGTPTVAVEYAPHAMRELGFAPEHLAEWFTRRGYTIYVLGKRAGLEVADPIRLAELEATRRYVDLVCSRRALDAI